MYCTYHGGLLQIGQTVDLTFGVGDALPIDLPGHLELEQSRHLPLSLIVQVRDVVARGDGEAAEDDGRDGEGREHQGDEELAAFSGHGWILWCGVMCCGVL